MNQELIKSFNDNLKEIRILELVGIGVLSIFLIGFLEVGLEWLEIIPIIYVLFRTRNNLTGLKNCATNLFSTIPFKTWILLGIAGYVFALGLGLLSSEMFPSEYYIFKSMEIASSGFVFIGVDFLFSVILGPACEELVFRGILLNRINKRIPLVLSIILTSILFSLFHPIEAQISSFIFGIVMCIAYLISNNILVPITLHMLNNLLSMAVSHIPNIELAFHSQIGMIILGIFTVISLIYIIKFIIEGYNKIKSPV
ncbi:CPBP family intramembrane glutamic endopeptidase [Methanobrevibacter sp.]|uniref:CPBP family intramembrane glutamic endopeptidase n=1 Tax=Methanobrevibacter sp. TaxID=66852 RepID=UPI00388E84D4